MSEPRIVTKADACEATRGLFRLMFKTMAAQDGYWHLYAAPAPQLVTIGRTGEPGTLLVANVHAGTEQQVVNSLCIQLDREGTPTEWIEGGAQ